MINQRREKKVCSTEISQSSSDESEQLAQKMEPKCSRGDFIVANQLEEELKK
jgi:hypothetical protein